MEPLAHRMKPRNLDEFFGQAHIIGTDKLLYRMIKADKLTSVIFYGPTGTGKTSLSRIISNTTHYNFVELNATNASVSDIKKIAEDTKNLFVNPKGKTIVFIDEIHRFNKLQQDSLLPYVEKGLIVLIGATTENPYFEVNKALVSRSTIFKFEKLNKEDIKGIISLAIKDKDRGLGLYNTQITEEVIEYLSEMSNGDVRTTLNALELAIITTEMNEEGIIVIDVEVIKNCIERKIICDKETRVDNMSAFIKSMRGSDLNATVHYLARMLVSGEDSVVIARRIVIAASEDVGLENNEALIVATSALQAVKQIGMPESRIILSHAALCVANSNKSNKVYVAIDKAIDDIKDIDVGVVPEHLKNSIFNENYINPHEFETKQQYLPDKIKDKKYYI